MMMILIVMILIVMILIVMILMIIELKFNGITSSYRQHDKNFLLNRQKNLCNLWTL